MQKIASLETQIEALVETQQKAMQRVKWEVAIEVYQGVFKALAAILAVRLMLLLALVGGFFLANRAMDQQTVISVVVLVAYAGLVIIPPAFLEYGRKFSIGGSSNG